jgi:hypothetical protein
LRQVTVSIAIKKAEKSNSKVKIIWHWNLKILSNSNN